MIVQIRHRIRRLAPSGFEVGTAVAAALVGISGSFASAGPTTDFVVTPVNSFVVSATPGIVVIWAIRLLGTFSELLSFAVAGFLTVGLLSIAAVVGLRVGRWSGDWFGTALGVYFAGWAVAAIVTRTPIPSLAVAIPMAGTAGVLEYLSAHERTEPTHDRRRRVLQTMAGVVGIGAFSVGIGLQRTGGRGSPLSALSASDRKTIESKLRTARRRSFDVEGIPGLVSSIDDYYEVDINTIDPDVDVPDWELVVTGSVGEELRFTYGDFTSMETHHRFNTLRCVGDPLNGHLMDNALWTGVPIRPLLERAEADGTHVMLRAVDGYYEEFPIEALRGGFLAYAMNGRVLPRDHGYPVRALVPGHWGEVNVKWLDEIEVLDHEAKGYWEKRGWHGTGPVNTIAKLWAVNRLDDGRMQVAGHAYAGTRGVRRVEVSVDGGDTWEDATLSPRLSGDDVWRQWKYEWSPSRDEQVVVVRAVDGTGDLQPRTYSQPYPSGATGWVSRTIHP